ncbi:MAG TPA: hypothetical protein VL049_07060 [Candidatus Dormibacteraeota bacterium]|nr:hypothetical protein [Candidatus Dormibacteraeota bacterium]
MDVLAASLAADRASANQLRAAALVLEQANRSELEALAERVARLEAGEHADHEQAA